MRVYSGFSKKYFKMKIAIKTANRGRFFVATYIMKAEILPVRKHKYKGATKNYEVEKVRFSEIGVLSMPEKRF